MTTNVVSPLVISVKTVFYERKTMTAQQTPKLAGALVEHQAMFADLSTEEAQWAIKNIQEAIGAMVKGLKEAFVNTALFIKALITITLGAVPAKQTKDCFTDSKQYGYRDQDLDNWLPKEWESRPEGKATVWGLLKGMKFVEMVQHLLKTSEIDVKKLSRLLIEGGHIFALPEIEALIERQEAGEEVGLLTNGYANFFFVLDSDGNVSVVNAFRDGRQWFVFVSRLYHGYRWDAAYRFFSRN